MNANSCSDLYKAIGEDFWLATWCNSTALEGYIFWKEYPILCSLDILMIKS